MYEHIGTVFTAQESVPLGVVEPLDCTLELRHDGPNLSCRLLLFPTVAGLTSGTILGFFRLHGSCIYFVIGCKGLCLSDRRHSSAMPLSEQTEKSARLNTATQTNCLGVFIFGWKSGIRLPAAMKR